LAFAVTCTTITVIIPDSSTDRGYLQHREHKVSTLRFSEDQQRIASEERIAKAEKIV
jgi:hypothetical protein